jgi:hypothetical protein
LIAVTTETLSQASSFEISGKQSGKLLQFLDETKSIYLYSEVSALQGIKSRFAQFAQKLAMYKLKDVILAAPTFRNVKPTSANGHESPVWKAWRRYILL